MPCFFISAKIAWYSAIASALAIAERGISLDSVGRRREDAAPLDAEPQRLVVELGRRPLDVGRIELPEAGAHDGGSCPLGTPRVAHIIGEVVNAYQSEAGSVHFEAASVGQPMSAWNPAIAVPKTNPLGKAATPASGEGG